MPAAVYSIIKWVLWVHCSYK